MITMNLMPRSYQARTILKVLTLYSVVLIGILYAVFASLGHSNTIILGSEMNTNGYVEYLCIGRGCDKIY